MKETFDNLRVYKMMFNPAKCVFGVPAGKLLGFLVSNRGIEANLEKIKAITSLAKPVYSRCSLSGGSYCSIEPVYQPFGRKGNPSVSDDEEDKPFRLE